MKFIDLFTASKEQFFVIHRQVKQSAIRRMLFSWEAWRYQQT